MTSPMTPIFQSSVNVAYDADNQKVAATQYIDVDGTQIMVKSIMDYKHVGIRKRERDGGEKNIHSIFL